MGADRLTPDDEVGGGGYTDEGAGGRYNDYHDTSDPSAAPAPEPHPTPELHGDKMAVIAALARASEYYAVGEPDTFSTEGITNESSKKYYEEQMDKWLAVPEYESLIKPYQLSVGPFIKSGVFKIVHYIFAVPQTGRFGIGEKQSVTLKNSQLTDGWPTSTCFGLEGEISIAGEDGLTKSMDTQYNVNLGYVGFTFVPDKGLSVRIESCLGPNFGVSIGVSGSRGFRGTISRPKQHRPPPVVTPINTPSPGRIP